jgi:hypothetical protein
MAVAHAEWANVVKVVLPVSTLPHVEAGHLDPRIAIPGPVRQERGLWSEPEYVVGIQGSRLAHEVGELLRNHERNVGGHRQDGVVLVLSALGQSTQKRVPYVVVKVLALRNDVDGTGAGGRETEDALLGQGLFETNRIPYDVYLGDLGCVEERLEYVDDHRASRYVYEGFASSSDGAGVSTIARKQDRLNPGGGLLHPLSPPARR